VKKFSIQEIKKHNKIDDCWVILGKKVYNCTSFIKGHSGGSKKILECSGDGKDYYNVFIDQ
jgi:cytochrome b involved in lipid metabolism